MPRPTLLVGFVVGVLVVVLLLCCTAVVTADTDADTEPQHSPTTTASVAASVYEDIRYYVTVALTHWKSCNVFFKFMWAFPILIIVGAISGLE